MSRKLGLAVLLCVTGAAAAACSSPSASPSSTSTTSTPATPSAAVLAAVHSSEVQTSADIHLAVTADVGGKNLGIAGGGSVDMANSAMQMNVRVQGAPSASLSSFSMVLVDGTTYVSYPGISAALPGKGWVSQPTSASTTSGVQVSNVSDMLKVLAAHGAVVTKVGPGTIGTTPVTAYDVTLTPALIANQASSLGVPASDLAEVQQALGSSGITCRVYVNSASQVRRFSLQLTVPATSTSPAGHEAIVVDFTNYGTPVSITAPPADQVASAQQLGAASS